MLEVSFSNPELQHADRVQSDMVGLDAPPTARRLRMTAMEHASAIQKSLLDLLRGIPGDITASPEDT
jgi:bacterioferritin (cytochrome b1)